MAVPWTADANESLHLSLVRAKEDKASLTQREAFDNFHPTFTYPIFGDDEKIYGYENLQVDLKFASGSLLPYLGISYSQKLPAQSAVDEIEESLKKFIPSDYSKDETEFLKRVEEEATSFKPIGEMIFSYSRHTSRRKATNGHIDVPGSEEMEIVEYEVYHSTWKTPGFKEYHRRMQLFILLYIEGGSYISEEEDVWEFMVLYEKRKRRNTEDVFTYHFVGYSTLYPFYCFPEKFRMRLSQFVILPPYQQEGHGSALYKAIYKHVISQPNIAELTVEDPAEAFEDLRDRNDLKMLLENDRFIREAYGDDHYSHHRGGGSNGGGRVHSHHGLRRTRRGGKLSPPAEKGWMERWRVELKIASRQFHRLCEMLILRNLDPSDVQAQKAFRLQVKERLYRFNYELLMQLDKTDRQAKLEETFKNVREDYKRILDMVH